MQRLKISVESLSFILSQLKSGELKIPAKGSYVNQRQLLAIAEKLINNEPLDKSVVAIKQGNKWLIENNAEFFWSVMLSKYGTFNELEGSLGVFYDFLKKDFFIGLPERTYEYAVRFDDFLGDSAEVLKTLSKEFIADYAEIKKVIMQYTNFAIHYYEEEV
jgi:hypothetical protein